MNTLTALEQGLQISRRASRFYVNYYWLRDNCRSAFHPQTRERVLDIWSRQSGPRPATAEIIDDELIIRWQDEDLESRFDLDWLEMTIGQGRADPASLPRKLWYADHVDRLSRFSQPELERDESKVAAWARSLLEDGVALVTDMRDGDESIADLARLLGPISPSVGAYFVDVIHQIDPVNAAFTTDALEMHTDTPNLSPPPGIKFFHCRANTVEGGHNLLIDGFAVASDFRATHREDFDILCRHRIPYFYENEGFDYRARHTVIALDDAGEIVGVRASRHLVDVLDLPQEVLDEFYPAFHRFGRLFLDPRYLLRFRMNPGECLVFDNHRVAHGRDAYTAAGGERHFRDCWLDPDELKNTYRQLVKRGLPDAAEDKASPAPPWVANA